MGLGGSELCAYDQPFNGEMMCRSWANAAGYGIPVDVADDINMLTNKKNLEFTISELEVWEATYLE